VLKSTWKLLEFSCRILTVFSEKLPGTEECVAFVWHHFYVLMLMGLLLSTKCNNWTSVSTGNYCRIIYTCGLLVAVYGVGLRTSGHLSWKGAWKILKLVNDKSGGTLITVCPGRHIRYFCASLCSCVGEFRLFSVAVFLSWHLDCVVVVGYSGSKRCGSPRLWSISPRVVTSRHVQTSGIWSPARLPVYVRISMHHRCHA